jgi:hypothetical protein
LAFAYFVNGSSLKDFSISHELSHPPLSAAPSRRSDVEILGYCMLHWLFGKLPWEAKLDDPVAVQTAKTK